MRCNPKCVACILSDRVWARMPEEYATPLPICLAETDDPEFEGRECICGT